MQEVEIRANILEKDKETIKKTLVENGYILKKSVLQHDIMFDREDASLFKSGCKIRLRLEGDKKELTYKGSLLNSKDVSCRTELNLPISNASVQDISNFMTLLGYPMCFQIKKERVVYEKDGISVSFDEWPIIGLLLEIEGNETEIKKLAKQIAPNYVFGNGRLKDFFADKMKDTGKSFEQLKFEYESETGFLLGKIELAIF